jgi:hypothetical protein
MKASIILTLLVALLFIRCKSNGSANDFSGIYVLQTQGEYAKDYDTIVVSLDHSSAKTYSVQNKTGFQKLRNGITMPKEFKKISWVATWDEEKHLLSESDLGRQIHFENNGQSLVLKNSIYQKIK